jgi:dTMP kinase
MKPLFITFEGIDGSGKTTHLKNAARWLTAQGLAVEVTKEPGGTVFGEELRALFLDRRFALDGINELLLVFASRRQHLLERIEPSLAAGRHVLCDRFTDSSLAYQGYGRCVALSLIEQVDRLATDGRRPDRTLLFDLPAEEARRRRHAGSAGDRLDLESLAFYERVRAGFLELAAAAPERFRIIDSSADSASTAHQVRAALVDLSQQPLVESL